jgi:hypothetical protein
MTKKEILLAMTKGENQAMTENRVPYNETERRRASG